ncbi:hypothetical protein [Hymenobacter convexus]|uniref:hypothetical protein n=1 Tax=Hymenobacter sp. CA1UV-4 TaxID=3063782 RepID=UPI0027137650|nr:hypothetical protein [Hymenobacter sp. CA1UV-4]MDO7853093.1 hypothetical protein [Hymenobacter sp. CA1UV-4]
MAYAIQNKQNRSLIAGITIAILVISVARFFLVGKGAMMFPDETRYYNSLKAAEYLMHGNVQLFFHELSGTYGRPGDALVRLLPALLQEGAFSMFGLNTNNPDSLIIPVLFNCIIVSISLFLFYRISLLLLADKTSALVATLIYGSLVNSNIYIRHILPYDTALCLMLYLVYYVLKRRREAVINRKDYALVGALSALLIAIYPGFYMAPFLAFALLIQWDAPLTFVKEKLDCFVAYAIGGSAVLSFFELLSRAGGKSYLLSSFHLAHTIDQGSYEEGYSFLFKYLAQVEGILGVVLIIMFSIYFVLFVRNLISYKLKFLAMSSDLDILVFTALGFFLLHATATFFLHKMVFYGRLTHHFIPFMVIAAVYGVKHLLSNKLGDYAMASVGVLAVVSFAVFFFSYQKVEYPFDLLYSRYSNNYAGEQFSYFNEIGASPGLKYDMPQPRWATTKSPASLKQDTTALVNFAFLFPIRVIPGPNPLLNKRNKVLYSAPHFINFKPYQFEGYNIQERELLQKAQYKYQIVTE